MQTFGSIKFYDACVTAWACQNQMRSSECLISFNIIHVFVSWSLHWGAINLKSWILIKLCREKYFTFKKEFNNNQSLRYETVKWNLGGQKKEMQFHIIY